MATTEKGRWAVIVKSTGEVSDIKRMEGGSKPDITHPELYDLVEVGPDVKIGMVRKGGKFAFEHKELQAAAEAEAKDPEGDGDKADKGKPAPDKSAGAAQSGTQPSPNAGKGGRV